MGKANATDIVKKSLDKYPNLKMFLTNLMRDIKIETTVVGKKFQVPRSVIDNKLSGQLGVIMGCFINKHLSNQFSTQARDDITELVLNNKDIYIRDEVRSKVLAKDIEKHYNIFKDPETKAMDILDSIKKMSLSTLLYFHDPIPKVEVETDSANLLAAVQYFKKLPYGNVEIKPNADCKYFCGNADIVFDRQVMYEIKNTYFQSVDKKIFYKMIMYSFGYYKKTGQIIKTFKIYNPLLGEEYTIKINNIDMQLFENAIAKDVGHF